MGVKTASFGEQLDKTDETEVGSANSESVKDRSEVQPNQITKSDYTHESLEDELRGEGDPPPVQAASSTVTVNVQEGRLEKTIPWTDRGSSLVLVEEACFTSNDLEKMSARTCWELYQQRDSYKIYKMCTRESQPGLGGRMTEGSYQRAVPKDKPGASAVRWLVN